MGGWVVRWFGRLEGWKAGNHPSSLPIFRSLRPRARGGERIDVWADAACNDLFGNLQGNGTVVEAAAEVPDE